MKRKMILHKQSNIGNNDYFLETVESKHIVRFCRDKLEKYFPSFAKKKDGTCIEVDIELIPCSAKQALGYEFVIAKTMDGYDFELYKPISEHRYAYQKFICRHGCLANIELEPLFEGLKNSQFYGLIVHY